MKVLWFTGTPSLYGQEIKGYNGCGWISSLEEIISTQPNIELAISFFHNDNIFKVKKGNTTYYPISLYDTKFKKFKHNLFYSKYDSVEIDEYLKVVNDFKPDIIHVFGSEKSFGLISNYTKIPVVIHIQGLLNPYLNAMFAPGTGKFDYFKYLSIKDLILKLRVLYYFTHNTRREQIILKECKFFMGRTEWDKNVTQIFSPKSIYFHCEEMLRAAFYQASPWINKNDSNKIVITTTISKIDYKGFDLILKTASILTNVIGFKFQWNVYGIYEFEFWEKKLKINSASVNVHLMGVATPETLINALQNSDIYIHPSYIDNSPNSVCEAQIIGLPIISTNVGGISSLIQDGKTGLLVPANDPYTLAYKVLNLSRNTELLDYLSKNSRTEALKRHDPTLILNQNISVYTSIINGYKVIE